MNFENKEKEETLNKNNIVINIYRKFYEF